MVVRRCPNTGGVSHYKRIRRRESPVHITFVGAVSPGAALHPSLTQGLLPKDAQLSHLRRCDQPVPLRIPIGWNAWLVPLGISLTLGAILLDPRDGAVLTFGVQVRPEPVAEWGPRRPKASGVRGRSCAGLAEQAHVGRAAPSLQVPGVYRQ